MLENIHRVNLHINFLKIYLLERQIQIETDRFFTCWFTSQMAVMAGAGSSQSQEPGALARSTWMAEPKH